MWGGLFIWEVCYIFEEKLIIMEKKPQPHPSGGIQLTWSEGTAIEAKLSISNMQDALIAQAQGVKAIGYLVVDADKNGKPKYPVELSTYLKYPKGGFYLRVADGGILEAGGGVFKERQYAVESLAALPTNQVGQMFAK